MSIFSKITFSKKTAFYGLIGIVVFLAIKHFYFKSDKNSNNNAVAVTVSAVQQNDVTVPTHAIGNVQPITSVSVKTRVDGQLLTVGFKEGDYVKEGQVLFQIDPAPFRVALQQAEANLAHDEAQWDNFKKTLERYQPLVKKGYISQQEYDQASANSKSQEAAVLADKAAVANAQLNVDYCTIRATISGRTGNLLVSSGNLVKASDQSPLVVINQISPISITFSLPEQQLGAIQQEFQKGALAVTLQVKDQNKQYQGKVSFIDNAVDTSTGMIKLKAEFDNQHEELWPGEFVDVTLPYAKLNKALLVPTRAIQASPDGAYVFLVSKDATVTLQPIKIIAAISGVTAIDGVNANDKVVVTGQAQLVDGSSINIIHDTRDHA